MPDIFVSYSRTDDAVAQNIAARLCAANHECWMDTDSVRGGASWLREIQRAIDNCQVVIALVSNASVASKWVERELLYATQLDKDVIPILLADRPLPLNLVDVQPISVAGDSYDRGLERLLAALSLFAEPTGPTATVEASDKYVAEVRTDRSTSTPSSAQTPRVETDAPPGEAAELLAELEDTATTHQRRAEIGDRLAEIGDTRPGVGLNASGVLMIDWCEVPAGEITLEDEGGTFKVEPFYIARYPVTRVQYRAFLEAKDGYSHEIWWSALKCYEMKHQPAGADNHPATRVSWYVAQ